MTVFKISESAVTGRAGSGCEVPVRVLGDDGTTARVLVEGAGVYLRQGGTRTVASAAVQRR